MIGALLGRFKAWLVAAGLFALLLLSAGRNGRVREKLRAANNTNHKQKGMQDAAGNTSQRKSDLVDRLRNGGF